MLRVQRVCKVAHSDPLKRLHRPAAEYRDQPDQRNPPALDNAAVRCEYATAEGVGETGEMHAKRQVVLTLRRADKSCAQGTARGGEGANRRVESTMVANRSSGSDALRRPRAAGSAGWEATAGRCSI